MPEESGTAPTGLAPEIAFVLGRGQNAFFVELVEVLRDELAALGVAASVTVGGFPPPSAARVYVVLPPHEYASLEGAGVIGDPTVLGRTIIVGAEQPGTQWFAANLAWATGAGAVFDINPRGVDAYRRHGIAAALLPLGYTTAWDTSGSDRGWDDDRDIDVLFLGSRSERRDHLLAACAGVLGRHSAELVISDNDRPNVATSGDFLAGADKRALLRRARVLLNLHRTEEPYFEWLRVIEAVHGGAVVITEPSTGMAPMRAGRDLLVTSAASLPWVLESALGDVARLGAIRRTALETLRDRPMGAAAAMIARTAASLTDEPVPVAVPPPRARPAAPRPVAPAAPLPALPSDAVLAGAVERLRLEVLDLRRQLARSALVSRDATVGAIAVVASTPGYRAMPTPRVTVAITMFDDGSDACRALASVGRGTGVRFEVIVVDDGSYDDSSGLVAQWIERNPAVPVLLVRHAEHLGRAAARSTALDFARGGFLCSLDGGDCVHDRGLALLAAALAAADQDVAYAYGMVEAVDANGSARLHPTWSWDPGRGPSTNGLDAMPMFRTRTLRAAGGFSAPMRPADRDRAELQRAFAERGERGQLVRSIIGRTRTMDRVLTGELR